jgi:hypothetical protein
VVVLGNMKRDFAWLYAIERPLSDAKPEIRERTDAQTP